MPEFEIEACHANRAGRASVSLRHVETGALVMIHHMPFTHDGAETVESECRRIQAAAAHFAERALAFLDEGHEDETPHPPVTPGAAPRPNEGGDKSSARPHAD